MKTTTLFLFLSFLFFQSTFGQTKLEREYRIQTEEVPTEALAFVDALKLTDKIKWYKEEGFNTTSIEAKTKYNGQKYSIEFNNGGEIEDVEIEEEWKDLPSDTRENICDYLTNTYDKARIDKIQIQYTGQKEDLISAVSKYKNKETTFDDITIHYELIVRTVLDKKHQMLEYLFTEKGEMVRKSVIIFRNTDNLEY